MPSSRYRRIIDEITRWAAKDDGIRAALIVGSQARQNQPADEWSDLDVVLVVNDPETLLRSVAWLDALGSVVLTFVETTGLGFGQERRVLFSDGIDVDFAIFAASILPRMMGRKDVEGVLGRGFRILVDKTNSLSQFSPFPEGAPRALAHQLESSDFLALLNDFWYHQIWAAKKLRRGEIWTAKFCCDGHQKFLLLRLIEWRAILESQGAADVWHEGRFVDHWAPPDFLSQLPSAFAKYDRDDIARAIVETGKLFANQAHRVAREAHFHYPSNAEVTSSDLLASILDKS